MTSATDADRPTSLEGEKAGAARLRALVKDALAAADEQDSTLVAALLSECIHVLDEQLIRA